ncbi:hypothetical protein BDZ91DRAFT_745346 [Kalaharituber pfeilii]|nr:hypothetical protein BDZ91DRAFT_745346 [Kalaharituber pfeilii]
MSLVVLSLAIAQGYASFERRKKEKVVVGKYVHLVLRTLQRQAQRQGAAGGEEFLPVVQMRDRVLQHEFDPERRKRVWEKVQRVIECNSNGEVLRCWTWIGGVLEEGESAGAGNGTMVKKEEDLDDGQWWMNRAVAW